MRVFLVDPQPLYARGFCQWLSQQPDIVADAMTGAPGPVLARAREFRPDVLVLGLDPELEAQLALLRALTAALPQTVCLGLTAATSLPCWLAALEAGAAGVLARDLSPDALLRALRGAMAGEFIGSRRLAHELLLRCRPFLRVTTLEADGRLTPREREVLALLVHGARDGEIAEALCVSVSTVKKHVQAILRHTGARNRAQAVSYSISSERSASVGGEP